MKKILLPYRWIYLVFIFLWIYGTFFSPFSKSGNVLTASIIYALLFISPIFIIELCIRKKQNYRDCLSKTNCTMTIADNDDISNLDNERVSAVSMEKKLKISSANNVNPYTDITPYELGNVLPFVSYDGFHPMNDEILIYAAPAMTFKDKEQVLGYQGRSIGTSVRVTKGVYYKTGNARSQAIRGNVRKNNVGDLLLTNKRIIFIGKDECFEFQVGKISTIKSIDANSFVVQAGRTSKNIWLDREIVEYAYDLINFVVDQNTKGNNLYESINLERSQITQEQRELYDRVRCECDKMAPKKTKDKQGCAWSFVKLLLILLVAVIIGGIVIVSVVNDANIVGMKFVLSDASKISEEVFVGEQGSTNFYIYPPSVDGDDIELVNSDNTKALCIIKDVRSVNGKKLITISFTGLEVGECNFYIKEKDGDSKSDIISLVVKEKQIEVDNSRTVYLTYSGDKYHYSSSCAGKSAYESTLNYAKRFYSPCSKCVK